MNVVYRDAMEDDAVVLADLGARTFTTTFGHLYSAANLAIFLENHTPKEWKKVVAGHSVRLAEADGIAIAYARIGPLTFEVDQHGRPGSQLYQLYVETAWHGAGVAAELLDWAIATARLQGAADLWLSVFIDNPRARRFYARAGFVEVMSYKFMVGDHADEDIICRLALDGSE